VAMFGSCWDHFGVILIFNKNINTSNGRFAVDREFVNI
jgi:hypothetical protein